MLFRSDADGVDPSRDSYRILLSQAPARGETVTLTVQADPSRTQRGAGLLGIRAFEREVQVNGGATARLSFTADDWFLGREITVSAAPDDRVDGDDSRSFAAGFELAANLEGAVLINGGVGDDRSGDLEREPVMLPSERNLTPGIGREIGRAHV